MAEKDPVKYFKSEIKRPNYYNSQFLVDTDFNDEQLYHKQMRRFHNRSLHTWGIVEGLNVERVTGQNQVTVSPGTAIDRLGQEIVLPERSGAIGLDKFDAGAQVYVVLKYADVTDPSDKSDSQGEGGRYKRWTERPEVYPLPAEPAADSPEVVLAVVTLDTNKAIADVISSKRRYAGSRFGSSGDGKEFSAYADAAGAWHFFDGGKGADRLTVDEKGNVGIGTAPSAARLSILTTPGPYDGSLMDFAAGGGIYRLSLRSKSPARDTVAYHFDLVNNLGRFDDFLVFDRGNVGIGTAGADGARLAVDTGGGAALSLKCEHRGSNFIVRPLSAGANSTIIENTGGGALFINPNGGNVSIGSGTRAPSAKLDVADGGVFIRHGSSAGIGLEVGNREAVTANVPNGRIGFPGFGVQHGQMRWVPAAHSTGRFEFVDSSSGSPSGDYGADAGNVAIRAGRGHFTGYLGVGTANPLGPLSVGDSSVAGSDGYIVVGKKTPAGATRHARIGYDAAFNFVIGDYGYNNNAGTWSPQLSIAWQAPANSLNIDSGGNVTMKGNSLTLGSWTIVSDGDNLYFKHGTSTVVRFSSTWDRILVFKNLDGARPYFYYNQGGNFGNYTG